tara:strand:+ start:109 stop:1119 length:1011 start_codon:yes stop_codon:yes gene_type:complete
MKNSLEYIYKKKLSEGIKYYPYVRPNYLKKKQKISIYPLSSISNVNTLFCSEEKARTYKSDKYGFNNENIIWDKKIDVALIGDSFVHGSCVENKNNISNKLIKFSKKNVLNLGFSGSGPLVELGILKEYAKKIKPEYLFWFYYEGNDMMDDVSLLKTYYVNYLDTNFTQNLISRQEEIDQFLITFINKRIDNYKIDSNAEENWLLSRIKLFLLRHTIYKLLNKKENFTETEKIFENFEKIVYLAKMEVENWNGRLVFVYIPDWFRYKFNEKNNENFHLKNKVIEIFKKEKIDVIDIEKEFSKSDNPLKYFSSEKKHTHYNNLGYDLISKKLNEYIE